MGWIDEIPPDEATGRLARTFRGAHDPELGRPANVLTVHGLAPQILDAHLALYRRVVKAPAHVPWFACETVATVVSAANACRYCTIHHAVALSRALAEEGAPAWDWDDLVPRLVDFGRTGDLGPLSVVEPPWRQALAFARKLTRAAEAMERADVEALRRAGLSDAAILEVSQVVAYFNYVNRLVLGLGVELEPEYEARFGALVPPDRFGAAEPVAHDPSVGRTTPQDG